MIPGEIKSLNKRQGDLGDKVPAQTRHAVDAGRALAGAADKKKPKR